MSIRIAHEAPKSIFSEIQSLTDYDYALVHLCEQDSEYFNLFKAAVEQGREVILDNSVFELGTSFDPNKYVKQIQRLQPTWYIVPDTLEDAEHTLRKIEEWNNKYRNKVTGKTIGVVQGKTYEEIVECYTDMVQYLDIDMVAISFDYSYYTKIFPHPNKFVSYAVGRVKLLNDLKRDGILDLNKPHHLLGSALPFEGRFYKDHKWIYSMDTSNPVVHAIKNIKYEENFGLYKKDTEKLCDLISTPKNQIDMDLLKYNVLEFRKYWIEGGF